MLQSMNPFFQLTCPYSRLNHLLLLLFAFLLTTSLGSAGLLALDTARAAATIRRGEREVDVLLGVEADHVGGDVDDLLADTVQELASFL